MAQLIRITSEALQATVRRLLPSQQGFGEDLQASNVIQPIIDLTPSAEGSEVRQDLQTSLALDSQTAFDFAAGTSTTLITGTGFWRVTACASIETLSGATHTVSIDMTDGITSKTVWGLRIDGGGSDVIASENVDLTFFLRAGDSLTATRTSRGYLKGSVRQIADINGNLINPSGFNPQ